MVSCLETVCFWGWEPHNLHETGGDYSGEPTHVLVGISNMKKKIVYEGKS